MTEYLFQVRTFEGKKFVFNQGNKINLEKKVSVYILYTFFYFKNICIKCTVFTNIRSKTENINFI